MAARRSYTFEEKRRIVDETRAPGASVNTVARKYAMSASQLFRWRRLADSGVLDALGAAERDADGSEVLMLRRQVQELKRLLANKTLECEILKEAIEIARSRGVAYPCK